MKPIAVLDYLVSKKQFLLKYNADTKAWETTPKPTQNELHTYYPKDKYASYANSAKGLTSALYLWVKKQNIKTKISWLNNRATKGPLIDVGAGNGAFAQEAKQNGWDVFVTEFNDQAQKNLQQKGFSVLKELLLEHTFSAITLWHVFEHLPNPEDQLQQYYDALVPGGVLVLALPNYSSWDAIHYGSYWAAYDAPRHLYHYNKEAIYKLSSRAGFELIKTHNMFWDAFYICLLSERYRKSFFTWPLAFAKGLYSNLVGWPYKNTSSLTFILQKPK